MILSVNIRQTRVSEKVPDLSAGRHRSRVFEDIPVVSSTDEALREVQAYAPLLAGEVVPWMQMATAANILLWQLEEDYGAAGGRFVGVAGDPASPGLQVTRGLYFPSQRGSTVSQRGYAVLVTPRGTFRAPVGRVEVFITEDLLVVAAVPRVWSYQWLGMLSYWPELGRAPFDQRLVAPRLWTRTLPHFLILESSFPIPVAVYTIGFSSPTAQQVFVTGRNTTDYRKVLFEQTLDVPAGESEYQVVATGIPYSDPMLAEIEGASAPLALDYVKRVP